MSPRGRSRGPDARRRRLVPLRVVPQEQHQRHQHHQSGHRAPREGGGPADPVQDGGEDERGDEVARHADQPGELRHQRPAPGREPAGAEPQHRDEGHRVAAAEQRPRGERHPVGGREREAELADGEEHRAQRQHLLGAEPVDHQAHGYLHAGVDEQLEEGEGGQRRGVDVEAVGGVETGHAQAGTEDHRHEVDGDADGPDGDGPSAAGRVLDRLRRAPRGRHRPGPRTSSPTRPMWPRTTAAAVSASPARSASRISECSARVRSSRSGWACSRATPIRSCRSRSWS